MTLLGSTSHNSSDTLTPAGNETAGGVPQISQSIPSAQVAPPTPRMQVPLLDLKPQYAQLSKEFLTRLTRLLESQEMILGSEVERFEKEVASYLQAPFALGCSSGTDALILALHSLEIGKGDAVITTPYSFFATAGSIWRVGAEPVFVDIDPVTFNLDPLKLEEFLSQMCNRGSEGGLYTQAGNRIRALMPVHLFGLCADMDPLLRIARRENLRIIEDAAQAIGAEYPSVTNDAVLRAGTSGTFGCFSFYPTKNLGAFGDAGLVTCKSERRLANLRSLRNHGMEKQYLHEQVGGNFRIDAMQAAVLSVKLPHLDKWSARRRQNAALYRTAFDGKGLVNNPIKLPAEPYAGLGVTNHHIYNQFVIRTPRRDALMAHLKAEQVGCAVYYPIPLHLQPCFAPLGGKPGDFPEAERASQETLALPIFPDLVSDQIEAVVDSVARFFAS